MQFGLYRKIVGRTGVGHLYQFLLLARHHTSGAEVVVYIPLRIEPEWAGTIRPCFLERALFAEKFEFAGERLPETLNPQAADTSAQTLREENERLQRAARVPGAWVCDTCGFRLQKMKLRANDMAVGVDSSDVQDICPNDGTSMRALTWKEDAEASDRVGIEQMKRADAAESAAQTLREALETLKSAQGQIIPVYNDEFLEARWVRDVATAAISSSPVTQKDR